MSRRGITLAEASIAMAIALVLGMVCQDLLVRASRLFASAQQHVELGNSSRALVENLVRDVAAAQQFLAAEASELALVRAADEDVRERLKLNADWAYPFIQGENGTVQKQPGIRVRYMYDAARHTVTRRAERGVLVCRAAAGELDGFDFNPDDEPADERVLASAIAAFTVRLLGRNAERELVVAKAGGLPAHRAALALVNFVGTPRVAMCVPLWSVKRRSDAVYPEYFSSTDEDLTW